MLAVDTNHVFYFIHEPTSSSFFISRNHYRSVALSPETPGMKGKGNCLHYVCLFLVSGNVGGVVFVRTLINCQPRELCYQEKTELPLRFRRFLLLPLRLGCLLLFGFNSSTRGLFTISKLVGNDFLYGFWRY